ncbi:MAG: NAD(P)-binding domain-containing protein [Melioribacteraceae bacterium]|nr:NAD(P)-binding domain-containing protein [Melioribacteraceae bacterium]
MKISIIGAGNVGSALAFQFANKNHDVLIGARNIESDELKSLAAKSSKITIHPISEAIKPSEIVILSVPPLAAVEIAESNKELLKNKIIVDASNSVFKKPDQYKTAFEGIKKVTGLISVVKCFNSTGFENMENPNYGNIKIDMFIAGNDADSKSVVSNLAKEIGFEECYDFGGDDKVELLEQFAFAWINLAIIQKYGRNISFKVLKR